MRQLRTLIKIQLSSLLGVNKRLHSPGGKPAAVLLIVGMALLGLLLLGMSGMYSFGLLYLFIPLGCPELALGLMMAAASVVTLFTTLYKTHGVLFGFGDYDLVMSLPVSTRTVVASRVLLLYGMNLALNLLLLLPAGVLYGVMVGPGPLFYAGFLLSLGCVPLIPLVVSALVGALITRVSLGFRHKQLVTVLLSVAAVVAVVCGSFLLPQSEAALTDLARTLADAVNRLYPLSALYLAGVTGGNPWALMGFIALSLGAFALFSAGLARSYKRVNSALAAHAARRAYRLDTLKSGSPFAALYRKELRRFFSSSLYMLNTGIGMVLCLVFSVALMAVGAPKIAELMEAPELMGILNQYAPLVLCFFLSMAYMTACSISLEGKSLWILLSAPVSAGTVFAGKVAMQLTLVLPLSLVSGVLWAIALGTGPLDTLMLLLVPSLFALVMALLGLVINLKLPNLGWKSEVVVIKQSGASLLSMLSGFAVIALLIGLMALLSAQSAGLAAAAQTGLLALTALGLYGWLRRRGSICWARLGDA